MEAFFFLPLAEQFVWVTQHLSLVLAGLSPPAPDQTGINEAFLALARRGAAVVGGAIALYLVYHGLAYLASDEVNRGAHAKHMFTVVLVSAIIVLGAVTIAPDLVKVLTGQP